MMNIVFNSDYTDGLFYYSYEYYCFLKSKNIDVKLIIFLRYYQSKKECIEILESKYLIVDKGIIFINNQTLYSDIETKDILNNPFLLMGISHLFHASNLLNQNIYSLNYKNILKKIYKNKLIGIYNERNIEATKKAAIRLSPKKIILLSDHLIFPNTKNSKDYINYSKRIFFEIYRPIIEDIKAEFLFNCSNELYYKTAFFYIKNNPNRYNNNILVVYKKIYDEFYKNQYLIPVKNLLGIFKTFVYTTLIFDNAPRFLQECFYFNKNIEYKRPESLNDGGKIYYELGEAGCDFNLKESDKILTILEDFLL